MKEIKKLLKLPKLDYYKVHLSLINCILPTKIRMTPKEIEVIAHFMSLEGDIAAYRFSTTAKKLIREQLDISPAGLSNYMGSLTEKGFINTNNNITQIIPLLVPADKEQVYLFKLVMEETQSQNTINDPRISN